MRHQIRGILGLVALATMPACVDLDEELVSGVSSQFYASPQGVEAAVNATYSHLRTVYFSERSVNLSEFGTDLWTNGDQGGNKSFNFYDAGLNPGNGNFSGAWADWYRAINTANSMLDRVSEISGMDPQIRDTRVAEVRFLRAFFYFHLVQTWGDVPLSLSENRGVITEMTRAPASEVYDAIEADLVAAIGALPVTQPNYGRATKGAAQHLLAKVLLTRAYKPYARPDDFQRAAQYAEAVIASGAYSLRPRYAQVFDLNAQRHSEVIFSVQSSYDPQLHANGGNRYHLYYMGFYDDSRGLPRSTRYGRAFRRLRPTEFALGLWDKTMDTRYHDSFQHIWYATANAVGGPGTSGGAIAIGDTAMWLPEFDVTAEFRASKPYRIFNFSQWRRDEEEFRFPSLLKHQDPGRPSINEENGTREYMYARLAETYLIAAEAHLGMGNPAAAVPHINAVRRRAARPGFEAAMEITAADVDLDFILDERGRELMGEVNRWYDLVRTGKFLERVMAHNRKAAAAGFVREHHALRPIPQSQIDAVENEFPQNPGY